MSDEIERVARALANRYYDENGDAIEGSRQTFLDRALQNGCDNSYRKDAIAAIAALEPEWPDISTAPKGKSILTYSPPLTEAQEKEFHYYVRDGVNVASFDRADRWFIDQDNGAGGEYDCQEFVCYPTHWMPVPQTPKESE